MSLLKQLKDDQLQARFNKDKVRASLLTSVYSDAATVGKNKQRDTTDEEAVAVMRKYIKGLKEIVELTKDDSEASERARVEINILENYLPEQLDEKSLTDIIVALVEQCENRTMKQMGVVMTQLNAQYPGQFDRAVASRIIQSRLS